MTYSPLVSIIIPVYNGSDYLKEAIESAIGQTYSNCEILVINDGSNDEYQTEKIALSFGDKVRYIYKPNGGVASALNLGIQEMKGEYFSWLSHDDLYLPIKVASQIQFINQFELVDSIIYSNYETIDGSGVTLNQIVLPEVAPEQMHYHLYTNHSVHGCSLLIPKKALVETGGFPEHLLTTQDYELWLALSKKYPFFKLAKSLIKARQHPEQGSKKIKGHGQSISEFYERHFLYVIHYLTQNSSPANSQIIQKSIYKEMLSLCFRRKLIKTANNLRCQSLQSLGSFASNYIFMSVLLQHFSRKATRIAPRVLRPFIKQIRQSLSAKVSASQLDFSEIYQNNGFDGSESVSGAGSTLFLTREVRKELPNIIEKFRIHSMLDIPCGDFNWMKEINLNSLKYIGADIVEEIIKTNMKQYQSPSRTFKQLNLTKDNLPNTDLIFCRDCLVHLPFKDIKKSIKNIKSSGSKWLLTTTFINRSGNSDLINIKWRPINLQTGPFNFPEPTYLLNEKCTEGGGLFGDKCLGLWKIEDLPDL